MVAFPLARIPPAPSIPWRAIVVVVLAKTAWDTAGMLAGTLAYTDPSYDVLRTMPPIGGMRSRGVVLGAVLVAAFLAARRLGARGEGRPMRLCLTVIAAWYMAWSVGIFASWLYHEQIFGWSVPASLLVVAILALHVARETPGRTQEVTSSTFRPRG